MQFLECFHVNFAAPKLSLFGFFSNFSGPKGVFLKTLLVGILLWFSYISFSGMQNLLYVKEVNTPNRFGGIGYIGFEKLTFVPIQVYKQCAAFMS